VFLLRDWLGRSVVFVVSIGKRLATDERGLQEESNGYYVGNAMILMSSTMSPSVVVSTGEDVCRNLALEIWDM